MKLNKIIFAAIILIFLVLNVTSVSAVDIMQKYDSFMRAGEMGEGVVESPSNIVARIIKIVLGFVGVIFIVLIIYAGFMWMTAAGNEERIEKAKKIIIRATIGIAIVLLAYTITYTITELLIESTKGTGVAQPNFPANPGP